MPTSIKALTVPLCFFAGLAACAEITTALPEVDNEIQRIEVSAETDVIEVGGTTQLTAIAFNKSGDTITATIDFEWSSDTPAVLEVSQAGVATGVSEGQARVEASDDEVVGEIEITVEAPSS